MICRKLLPVALCGVFAAGLDPADGNQGDAVPLDQCACPLVLPAAHFPPWGGVVQYACRVYRGAPVVVHEGPRQRAEVLDLVNDNCTGRNETPPSAVPNEVTSTDEGTVRGTAGFSAAFRAELNLALAGRTGIATTEEFAAGLSSATEVSTQHRTRCGSSAIRPGTGSTFRIESHFAARTARVPLYHRWYSRALSPNPGPWRPANDCGVAGFATIDARKGSFAGCTAEPINCGQQPRDDGKAP